MTGFVWKGLNWWIVARQHICHGNSDIDYRYFHGKCAGLRQVCDISSGGKGLNINDHVQGQVGALKFVKAGIRVLSNSN